MESKTLYGVHHPEWKFAESGGAHTVEGYGAHFNNVDGGGDLIKPGAFAEFLAARGSDAAPIPMFYEHDSMLKPGIWTSLAEDGKGLLVKGEFLDTEIGQRTRVEMQKRAITGLSIGFTTLASAPRVQASDPRRTITKVHLWEVSATSFPMNDKARVTDVKSAAPSEIEKILRDAGLSRAEAKAFMADGFKGLKRLRDAGDDADELAKIIRRNTAMFK